MSLSSSPYNIAHRVYVKSLYKRALKLSLDWTIRRDLWRDQAIEIRALFERNRNITNPRRLAAILQETERELDKWRHPDPYRVPTLPDGTKWERNSWPPIFSAEEKKLAKESFSI